MMSFSSHFPRSPTLLGLGLFLALALSPGWYGTVLGAGTRVRTIEELAHEAEAVALGRVVSIESTRDRGGHPFTRVEFSPSEIWKGTSTRPLHLASASTVLGERWVQVVGEEPFRLGEELVVFTRRNPEGDDVVLDPAQGRFRVHTDPTTGERHVENGLFGETPAAAAATARTPGQRRLSLAELRERVRKTPTTDASSKPRRRGTVDLILK